MRLFRARKEKRDGAREETQLKLENVPGNEDLGKRPWKKRKNNLRAAAGGIKGQKSQKDCRLLPSGREGGRHAERLKAWRRQQ